MPGLIQAGRSIFSSLSATLRWLVLALMVAWLAHLTPVYERLNDVLNDAVIKQGARPSRFENVVVIDIDDESLRALKKQLGPWPYPRHVHALLINYLRDMGAKTVVFDFVFGDVREGDEVLAAAISKKPDVVLAASGLQLPFDHDGAQESFPERLTSPVVVDSGSVSWSSMTLPTPALLAGLQRMGGLGVISAPLDADRHLRRLPLLHDSNGRLFPSLPLAAHLIQAPPGHGALLNDQQTIAWNDHQWPIDRMGKALLMLPSNAAKIPTLPLKIVVAGALGEVHDETLRTAIAGRTVFVGSSSFLGDTVATPQGDLTGTALLANAYVSLDRNDVVKPATWLIQVGFLGVALMPLCLGLRPAQRLRLKDVVCSAVVLVVMALLVWISLNVWRVLVLPLPGLMVLLLSWVFYALARRRAQTLAHLDLENERRVATAANVAKSQFLAHVSHELRTPLNAVLGMAQVLVRTDLSLEQRRYVDIFQHAGGLLSALLDDLLDLSKIEADRLQLDAHPFSLHTVVAQQIDLLQPRAQAKAIALTYVIDPQVPDGVQGDAKRLTQILVNLIGNAIKFTAVGGVRVGLTLDAQGAFCFSIRDTGIGIARDKLELIFQPFAQAEAGVARYYGGTGLGLSISKRLIELMGGQVVVDSEPGVGSTFRFTLKLPSAVLPAPKEVSTFGGVPLDESDSVAGVSILLAEDNELNVLVIESMLQKTPHTLAIAHSGDLALEMFKKGGYGLVLMDVQMPIMDGLQATRAIREFERQTGQTPTCIVALTAGAYQEDAQLSRGAGCDAHIGKPVAQAQLLKIIARLGRPH